MSSIFGMLYNYQGSTFGGASSEPDLIQERERGKRKRKEKEEKERERGKSEEEDE